MTCLCEWQARDEWPTRGPRWEPPSNAGINNAAVIRCGRKELRAANYWMGIYPATWAQRCHTATRGLCVKPSGASPSLAQPLRSHTERTLKLDQGSRVSVTPLSNMPAIKKERLDGDDMALTAFNQSEYLAPLNATAIPVVTPHPPPYDHIFAHHRAYLGLHDSALHHQHLHHHTDDLMLERFSSIPDFQPFFDNGEPCIEVECGENKALLYINKLCQGSKGPSIKYRSEWLTPNEFQFVSGRETAKDWKRSIRHKGKTITNTVQAFNVDKDEAYCLIATIFAADKVALVVLDWKGYNGLCVDENSRLSSTDLSRLWQSLARHPALTQAIRTRLFRSDPDPGEEC